MVIYASTDPKFSWKIVLFSWVLLAILVLLKPVFDPPSTKTSEKAQNQSQSIEFEKQ